MWVSLWKLICAHLWFLFSDNKSKPCTLSKFKTIHTGRKSKIAFPFQLFLLLPPAHLPSLLLLFFSPECPSFLSSSYPKHDILCWDQHSQEFSVNSYIFEKYLFMMHRICIYRSSMPSLHMDCKCKIQLCNFYIYL